MFKQNFYSRLVDIQLVKFRLLSNVLLEENHHSSSIILTDYIDQDKKLTQTKIDEIIDTSLLRRIAFHGQYDIGDLLKA